MTTDVATVTAVDRFAAKSRISTIIVFAIGYAIWQPLAQRVLQFVGGREPFQSFSAWFQFELAVTLLGAAVGAAWFSVQRRPLHWTRSWLKNTLRMTAFACMMASRDWFVYSLWFWAFATVLTSIVVGGLWAILTHIAARLGASVAV